MSYEEFLELPVDHITQLAQTIKFKRENNIPFSEEENEMIVHFTRYTDNLRLQEERARLEYCYGLDSYDKYK